MLLFTHSYFYRFDAKQWRTAKPYPPYGTMYAAGFMRQNGYEVAIFDTGLAHSAADLHPHLQKHQPKYLVIYDDGFNYLTKMCLTTMRQAAFDMAEMGKKQGCTVIVCSSDSTDHCEAYLRAGADFVLLGEGELTLLELVKTLEKNQPIDANILSGIMGLAYLHPENKNTVVKTLKRPILRNLDEIANPAWDLIDVLPYRKIWLQNHGYFSLNMATTRGCPFKCNWCAKPIYGNRYNSRSPQRVAQELVFLKNNLGANHIWMSDDIFGLKPGWVEEFSHYVQEYACKTPFKIQSRVDLLLEANTIDALIKAGLEEVWVGAESGSQKILDAMDKGTTVEQIFEATKLLKTKGVKVCFFLQFGYLGETRSDIDKTITMLLNLLPDDIGVSVSYPLPGTKFYETVKNTMLAKQNWTDSDDLELMYNGTYGAAFYKRLHRFVHKKYRQKQGLSVWQKILTNPLKIKATDLKPMASLPYYTIGSMFDAWHLNKLVKT
ncbi:MAG: B12-binding domain-containing radical SAM protein [Sphingobacteriales bacterium]|jgi:anaerobic magnesium-protoporphyrin IX monomethyl ester cyclase|nr:B12-binding domain-containing radical SAM protein [Sphingobacteriales bacterium]MBP9141042.1 B12-binding domain-containing radical SAM protein [Chitinophagales bacterium]MDA0199820.1 radical SAM protein [Bacteroidota bacterium]MBK7528060.1 B12-binding domain-containing radical SAM protein [Sphingobacteriales bacterium]MBL0246216.1 B12-binding domain-containing radical SAM protein [Sphingobacteriales bacterium]